MEPTLNSDTNIALTSDSDVNLMDAGRIFNVDVATSATRDTATATHLEPLQGKNNLYYRKLRTFIRMD